MRLTLNESPTIDWRYPLSARSGPDYAASMCRRVFLWLIPVMAFLAIALGSPCAFAHERSDRALSGVAENSNASAEFRSEITVSDQSSETGKPCDCPGGHCACTVDCAAACAAAVILSDGVNFQLSWVPPAFELAPADEIAGLMPNVDLDPPRPVA
jgi:hypothetical protein